MQLLETLSIYTALYPNDQPAFVASEADQLQLGVQSREFVYGEIRFAPFVDLLRLAEPKEGELFYDLGSGSGKAVMAAVLSFPFEGAYGVEMLPGLHAIATAAREQLPEELRGRVHLKQSNFFDSDFTQADVVYVAGTCLEDQTVVELQKRFQELKKGARVVLLGKQLQGADYVLVGRRDCAMGWGSAVGSVYRKVR